MKRGVEGCEQGARRLRGPRILQREVAALTWEKHGRSLQRLYALRREQQLDSQKLWRVLATRMLLRGGRAQMKGRV